MDLRNKPRIRVNNVFSKIAVGVVAVAVIVGVGTFFRSDFDSSINRDGYQLVNLSTGERFIGKLSGLSGSYVTLDDVYQQQVPATSDETQKSPTEITVAKLSSSVVKPENKMQIASDKIVHWENLQDDSKVVQAIKQDGTK